MKIGTKVKGYRYFGDRGITTSIPDDHGMVYVQWDSVRSDPELVPTDQLVIVDPVVQKQISDRVQDKLNKAQSAFEFAFQMIQESKNIASEDSSLNSLEKDQLIDTTGLSEVLEDYGWSTSSLYC